MFIKSTDCLYFNCCGFLFRFYHVYSIEHQEDETIWALQSLRMCMGIPGVIACSTFQVTFFCFFEEIFSAEMIPALPPVLCHFHQFCHILCGGGGGREGVVYCLLQNTSQSTVFQYNFSGCFYYDGVKYFITLFCFLLKVRRNESLLFITIFEVLNVNNYKTTKYCPSEMITEMSLSQKVI